MVLKQLVVFADSDVSLRLETVADQRSDCNILKYRVAGAAQNSSLNKDTTPAACFMADLRKYDDIFEQQLSKSYSRISYIPSPDYSLYFISKVQGFVLSRRNGVNYIYKWTA